MIILCFNCGKSFYRKPSHVKERANFCSKSCWYDSHLKRPERRTGKYIKCQQCRKTFYVEKNNAKKKKFCSMKCKGIASRRPKKTCKICGNKFIPGMGRPEQPTCSKECGYEYRTKAVTGTCGNCGIEISIRPSELKKRNFCSVQCFNKYQSQKDEYVCKICGKSFFWSPSRKANKPLYCSILCRNKCAEWKKNAVIAANMVQQNNKNPNTLEKAGYNLLNDLGVVYESQTLICEKFCVDAFLPQYKIVIQWDGDYWHGFGKNINEVDKRVKKRMQLDKSQDAYMKKAGYTVLRFWEHEVHKYPERVKARISKVQEQTRLF